MYVRCHVVVGGLVSLIPMVGGVAVIECRRRSCTSPAAFERKPGWEVSTAGMKNTKLASLKKLVRANLLPAFIAFLLLGTLAAAPATPSAPGQPTVVATPEAGTLNVSWPSSEGAVFYTVGWANIEEVLQMVNAGRDWLDAFHFATIPAQYTSHYIQGLQPDVDYYVVIGAKTTRYGGDPPVWSPWAEPVTTSKGQVSDCVSNGTCIPIQPIGTFAGSGDSIEHAFALQAGVYRFTASRTNTDGNFFVEVIELASGVSRSVGIYGSGETGGQEALTIYGPDRSFGLKAGNYILDVDTDHDWTVQVELIQAHLTPFQTSVDCTGDDYDRDEWGTYPAASSNATPRWTKPSDDVSSRDITQDHHVALKDAHISGGCDWSATEKDQFSSDMENLNPTTRSFNSSKANRTPDQLTGIAEQIIDTDAEKCDYATQHEDVKEKYSLTMTSAEQSTVDEWLTLCN